MADNVG